MSSSCPVYCDGELYRPAPVLAASKLSQSLVVWVPSALFQSLDKIGEYEIVDVKSRL